MMYFRHKLMRLMRPVGKTVVCIALLGSLAFAPLSVELIPQRAEAQAGCLSAYVMAQISTFLNIGSIIGNVLGLPALLSVPTKDNAVITQTTQANMIECVVKPMFWALAKAVIASMTDAIVDWIKGGFNGYPAFVSDFGGFMYDVADVAAGNYFVGPDSPLNFVCSPFKLDIQLATILNYYRARGGEGDPDSCRLSEAWANSTEFYNFLAGDFSQGGWRDWFDLVGRPENNPFGSYLKASEELTFRIRNSQGTYERKLEWGRGFFSLEDGSGNIVTPGTFVESQVQGWVGDTNLDQLELADSVDEVLYALGEQLVAMVFQSADGLLGLSEGSGDFSRVRDSMRNGYGNQFTPSGQTQILIDSIEETIEEEEDKSPTPERATIIADLNDLLEEVEELDSLNPPPSDWRVRLSEFDLRYREILSRINDLDELEGDDDDDTPPPPEPE